MGNYRLRFSAMIPNAWFYKLKDMSRSRNRKLYPTKKKTPASHNSLPTYPSPVNLMASDLPRKSSNRRAKRRTVYRPSPRPLSSTINLVWRTNKSILLRSPDDYTSAFESSTEPESPPSDDSYSFNPRQSHEASFSTCDIIIDVNRESGTGKLEKIDAISELESTNPEKMIDHRRAAAEESTNPVKMIDHRRAAAEEDATKFRSCSKLEEMKARKYNKKAKANPPLRKPYAKCRGIKPRIGSKKIRACSRPSSKRRSIAESFAVVKWSVDPQRDFKDSMVEMIVEKNIRSSEEMEELLACYLSVNSKEYHDLIVKAFEQIWFDIIKGRL